MKALVVEEKLRRFAAAKVLSAASKQRAITFGPLKLDEHDPLPLPNEEWISVRPRLSGICGSDVSAVLGRSSRYFEPLTSFPFTPGHEVVADAIIDGVSSRVVIEPALHCRIRGLPACRWCRLGQTQRCERILDGSIEPGIQTGYCTSVGGGWSEEFSAHRSQLHLVPDGLSDEDAVMIEPLACAIHSVLRLDSKNVQSVAVLGAGTIGLLTVAALRQLHPGIRITCAAKYSHQRSMAMKLGADLVVEPKQLVRTARSSTSAMSVGNWQSQGFDAVFDCVGSESSVTDAIASTTPGGTVVVSGMPSHMSIDLAPLWHREIKLVGSYAYGTEEATESTSGYISAETQTGSIVTENGIRTFDLAISMAQRLKLGALVTHRYGLENYEEAIRLAAEAGQRGAIKIAFDPRPRRAREQENRR